jgi:hypothetical protein
MVGASRAPFTTKIFFWGMGVLLPKKLPHN